MLKSTLKKMTSANRDGFNSEIKPEELFKAYFDCRKNKRNTINALAFEIDYESKLIELCYEINSGTYQPGKSIAFIVNQLLNVKYLQQIFVIESYIT